MGGVVLQRIREQWKAVTPERAGSRVAGGSIGFGYGPGLPGSADAVAGISAGDGPADRLPMPGRPGPCSAECSCPDPTSCPSGTLDPTAESNGSQIGRTLRLVPADAGMSTVEYAVGTVVADAFAAVLYKIVTGDSVVAGLTNLINSALSTSF
jgi:hypothetical protein